MELTSSGGTPCIRPLIFLGVTTAFEIISDGCRFYILDTVFQIRVHGSSVASLKQLLGLAWVFFISCISFSSVATLLQFIDLSQATQQVTVASEQLQALKARLS